MGVPVPAVDARARALGGVGLGLLGLNLSLVNPAEIAGLVRRGVAAALQPGSAATEIEGTQGDLAGARFPMMRLIYPVTPRVVASLGYGAFLEQSWGIEVAGFERIGADSVGVRDLVESAGGVGQLSLSVAYAVTPSFAIGGAVGLYTGNLDRRLSRSFADTTIGLQPFGTRLRWAYDGRFASVGARLDFERTVRVAASATVSSALNIEGREGAARNDESRLPIRLAGGASAFLSPRLMAALGAEWSGRGDGVESVFRADDAIALRRNTWRIGGGIEYEAVASGRRTWPVRIGASHSQLPYYNAGESPSSELSGSLGLGFRLASDEAGPLAVADVTLERGRRSGLVTTDRPGGLTESFWRFTFTLSLFGQ
jgi:hypothetical protein